ncbi:SDR family NAD(P)-dependent oxidoreductase [Herbivorax sp. ANBcel31]|uniref:SDR family NAD(P)-dependent oxidoreductase n=1 Tax=Herbivorax sp. ANBcel31 TaxID=3069754 RepID=UPI0027AEE56F|nr:SDR family NAD(P)-dependent oxidoreductase [Herbivorax sp. ANBcel31]MDQ2088002.1 SDR family NAD(P)-dependent oxidoreductase [Herbivorax sp. ANBcel31]
MKKAIVIGATSGIGRELTKILAKNNYIVGFTGRRGELLRELSKEITSKSYWKEFDISANESMSNLECLIEEMGKVDLIIICSGCGFINPELDFNKEKLTIDVNVSGFTAMVNIAMKHFIHQKAGHVVGISSIAALRGSGSGPAYSASKAFVSNYLEGLRQNVNKLALPITITNIQPGFVDTFMAQGEGLFWVASPKKAALQIYKKILDKKSHAYITKRWRVVACLLKIIPGGLYKKLYF